MVNIYDHRAIENFGDVIEVDSMLTDVRLILFSSHSNFMILLYIRNVITSTLFRKDKQGREKTNDDRKFTQLHEKLNGKLRGRETISESLWKVQKI